MAAVSKERLYQRLNADWTELIVGWLIHELERIHHKKRSDRTCVSIVATTTIMI